MALNLMSEAEGDKTDRRGGDNVIPEAEFAVMQMRVKGWQWPPTAGRSKEGLLLP